MTIFVAVLLAAEKRMGSCCQTADVWGCQIAANDNHRITQ